MINSEFTDLFPRLSIEFPIFIIMLLIFFRNLLDHPARIPGSYHPVRDIFGNHASGADYRIASDMNARQDDGISADPHIISDGYADPVLIE